MKEVYFSAAFDGEPPDGVPSETRAVLGLQAALDAVAQAWGGKVRKAETVYPAVSVGGGMCFLMTDAGRVILSRDEVAAAKARMLAQEETLDGRTRPFHATIYLIRVLDGGRTDEVELSGRISGDGLMGLCYQAAMWTRDKAGTVPPFMYEDACAARMKAVRAAVQTARKQDRASARVNFPAINSPDPSFTTDSGRAYRVALDIDSGAGDAVRPSDVVIGRRET